MLLNFSCDLSNIFQKGFYQISSEDLNEIFLKDTRMIFNKILVDIFCRSQEDLYEDLEKIFQPSENNLMKFFLG